MIAGQAEVVARLRRNTDAVEAALLVDAWNDASLALLGCWLAIDELRRGMPRPDPVDSHGVLLG